MGPVGPWTLLSGIINQVSMEWSNVKTESEIHLKSPYKAILVVALFVRCHDVTRWKYFPRYWSFCEGKSPVDSSHKDQWREASMFCLICAWTNGWANNRYADDLRRHYAHYDVIVMVDFVGNFLYLYYTLYNMHSILSCIMMMFISGF